MSGKGAMMTAIRASWNIPEVCRKKGQATMQELIDDFSLSPLLKAMEANVHGAWIRLGHALGAVVHDEPELLWFLSGLPFHLANGIVRTHFPSDTGEETFDGSSFTRGARLGLPDRYVAIDTDGAQSLSSLGISRVLHVSRLLLAWRVIGTETPHQATFLHVRKLNLSILLLI
jgi:hypothetical protein